MVRRRAGHPVGVQVVGPCRGGHRIVAGTCIARPYRVARKRPSTGESITVTTKQTGISNRQTPAEEERDREQLGRPDDVGRDQAGHLVSESAAEATEAEDDASRPKPDGRDGATRRDVRQSRAGG